MFCFLVWWSADLKLHALPSDGIHSAPQRTGSTSSVTPPDNRMLSVSLRHRCWLRVWNTTVVLPPCLCSVNAEIHHKQHRLHDFNTLVENVQFCLGSLCSKNSIMPVFSRYRARPKTKSQKIGKDKRPSLGKLAKIYKNHPEIPLSL